MKPAHLAGVRRSRHGPILWVDTVDWSVSSGDLVLIETDQERFLAQVTLPTSLLLSVEAVAPIGHLVAAGLTSPAVAAALQDRNHLALALAREVAESTVEILAAGWSIDLAALTLTIARPIPTPDRLRQKLGAELRALIRLELATEAE